MYTNDADTQWIVSNNEREDAEINTGTSECTVFNSLYCTSKKYQQIEDLLLMGY